LNFTVEFKGHPNVTAKHKTTLEITKESHLTLRGDCIIGVSSSASVKDLPEIMKNKIKSGSRIDFYLIVGNLGFKFFGYGHSDLSLSHPTDIVIRKSSFTSERTLAIKSSAAAIDVPRNIIELLQKESRGELIISIE